MAAAALPAALPLAVVSAGFWGPDADTLAHLRAHVLPRVAGNTALLVAGVVAGAGTLGTALAWLVAVFEFPGRRLFSWALLLPMAIPGYVMAFVYIGLFDYAGPVQSALRAWLGGGMMLPPIRSAGGVILVMTLTLYPYVYLIARTAFLTQGRRALEVGRSLGLSPARGFVRVALPMARPWLVGGMLLVAMETLADFGTVAAFNYDTFTTAIYQAWFAMFSLDAALHLAAFLVLPVLAALIAERRLRGGARYTSADVDATRLPLSGARAWLAAAGAGAVLAVAFLLPFGQLLAWSAQELAAADTRFFAAAGNSLLLAATAAVLIAALATLLSYAHRLRPGAAGAALTRLATLGYALPGPVLAVGVFVPLAALSNYLTPWLPTGSGPLALQTTLAALLLAYTARFLAVAHTPVDAGMQRITPSLDAAAAGLGVTDLRRLARIHLPMLRTGLLTGATLVFVDVMKEMPITLMTRPYGWDTLATRIYEFTAEGQWRRAALPGVALVLAGLLPVILLTLRTDRTGLEPPHAS
jgi:iron(III) transport system permease protein